MSPTCGQFDPTEQVRVRIQLRNGKRLWSERMNRLDAEIWLSSATWLAAPIAQGQVVNSAAIVRHTHD
jgi:hypothetical protein